MNYVTTGIHATLHMKLSCFHFLEQIMISRKRMHCITGANIVYIFESQETFGMDILNRGKVDQIINNSSLTYLRITGFLNMQLNAKLIKYHSIQSFIHYCV